MNVAFSLITKLYKILEIIDNISACARTSFGPLSSGVLFSAQKKESKQIISGSALISALELESKVANTYFKLLKEAALKTQINAGDGSLLTLLLTCKLLHRSLKFLPYTHNSILISKGLNKISFFLSEKILEYSQPVSNKDQLSTVLKTALSTKLDGNLINLLHKSIHFIERDGVLIVEENKCLSNELKITQGVEIDRGFASPYFVNDLTTFEVIYDKPYLFITNDPIHSLSNIQAILEHVKKKNRPLIIIAEEIHKDIISKLVLSYIKKKLQIVVIKFNSIKFIQSGILDDLAILAHCNSFNTGNKNKNPKITDLGQVEKVIVKKDRSIFTINKFSKIIARQRINELNRELLISETGYEKNIYKARIARLSGNITKIKVKPSSNYSSDRKRQGIDKAIHIMKSSLEEGCIAGGGITYFALKKELQHWSYVNMTGEEIFSMQIAINALSEPFESLLEKISTQNSLIVRQEIINLGYPYTYDLLRKKIVNGLKDKLLDSTKSTRLAICNAFALVSTLIESE